MAKYHSFFDVFLRPRDGKPGEPGPMPYPAGIYDPDKEYVRTKARAPFVLHQNGNYYIKEEFGIHKGVDPATDTQGVWSLFDSIQYVFTEVLLANYAKIAGGVHYDDKLISQYGVQDGEENSNYENYTGDNGSWQPNILLDFLTGKVKFNLAEIIGHIKAQSGDIGSFSIQNGNLVSSYIYGFTVMGSYQLVRGNVTINKQEVSIYDSYGGTADLPQKFHRSAKLSSAAITIESWTTGGLPPYSSNKIEIKTDGIYRNGTKIL